MALSAYALQRLFEGTYVGLLTATGEVRAGSYSRRPVQWATPIVDGDKVTLTNEADVIFPMAVTTWGRIEAVAIFDASNAGHLIAVLSGNLRPIEEGDQARFPKESLTYTVAANG